MKPTKSFWIWMSPRTGSTLLCKGLELTGVVGKPGEFLNIPEDSSLINHYKIKNYKELKERLWQAGMSSNGIMGIKYSLYRLNYDNLANEMMRLRNLHDIEKLDWQLWEDIFPNCKHIYLSRRNKIRLAVSWWKAIQDEQWHREQGEEAKQEAEFYADSYNFDALSHLLKENCLREAAIQEFFDYNKIKPLTIIYEDFVEDYEHTIRCILNYLELNQEGIEIGSKYYERTADEISETWVHRFRSDLQPGWKRLIW